MYRARGTRLARIVASKALPAHLGDRPVPGERFEREARTIASLNRPRKYTLYDFDLRDGMGQPANASYG